MAEKLLNIMKKPMELFGGAFQAIKGPDVQNLMESFTREMTVVTEGLYDDQMRLRKEVEELSAQQTIIAQQVLDGREDLQLKLGQSEKDLSARLNDMQKRLQALEANRSKQGKRNGVLFQVTILAAIVAGSKNKTHPYDGITMMLKELVRRRLKLCVFSNKPHQDTLNVTSFFFPDTHFDIIRGQKEKVPVKPDPTGALEIARELDILPKDFLYVGDTGVDMACANAAGMIPVGALWGFRPKEELIEHHARHLIGKPEDLLALLD
jgi:phosphoglycolate phosphatase-like HAD superfamily hydrolase